MASQLQASKVQGNNVPNPYTIPSILYSPEEAGGFNCEYIYEIGQKGLEVLQREDSRFKNYIIGKERRRINDVKFSYNVWDLFRSKEEIDRESLDKNDFDQLKSSIGSYLRLLGNYLQFPAALDTIEYLLRIYKIHIYDWEDLIFCSLPYHHRPEFVRIIQLLSPERHGKWDSLLDRLKQSGATRPRRFIFEDCLGDSHILNSLCEYTRRSRTDKYKMSKPSFMFTAAAILANLTSIGEVESVLVFLELGLQSGGPYQATTLMIISQLAKLPLQFPSFLKWIVQTSHDVNLVRLSILTLINFVELQSMTYIPKPILVDLIKVKDFAVALLGISKEFNISKFLELLLDSFIRSYDMYELRFSAVLASIIETVPMKNMLDLTSKVLAKCLTLQGHLAGNLMWKVVLAIHEKYPDELLEAVEKFLDTEFTESKLDLLSQMLNLDKVDKVDFVNRLRLTTLRKDSSPSQDKREMNTDDVMIELFGKLGEELVRDSSANASLVIAFNIFEDMVMKMDDVSIANTFEKMFGQSLAALDLRRQNPEATANNDDAERSITNAMASLMKRLSGSDFKLLFQRSIDWAESDINEGSGSGYKSIDRAISFYGLVNRLCEACGSIFAPYFREIIDQIISHLTKDSVSSRRAKKAKTDQLVEDGIPLKTWHLRALVLSFLNNCLLHDTGSLKFLNRNNLQALLEPIFSQAVVKPPLLLKEHPHVPAVEEVDEWLVSCITQMAKSYSDLVLKHEVPKEARSKPLLEKILLARQG